jgi:hypothetical protein
MHHFLLLICVFLPLVTSTRFAPTCFQGGSYGASPCCCAPTPKHQVRQVDFAHLCPTCPSSKRGWCCPKNVKTTLAKTLRSTTFRASTTSTSTTSETTLPKLVSNGFELHFSNVALMDLRKAARVNTIVLKPVKMELKPKGNHVTYQFDLPTELALVGAEIVDIVLNVKTFTTESFSIIRGTRANRTNVELLGFVAGLKMPVNRQALRVNGSFVNLQLYKKATLTVSVVARVFSAAAKRQVGQYIQQTLSTRAILVIDSSSAASSMSASMESANSSSASTGQTMSSVSTSEQFSTSQTSKLSLDISLSQQRTYGELRQ